MATKSPPMRRVAYWDQRYSQDPQLFGAGPSPFARWSSHFLAPREGGDLVEVGCGYGRDCQFWVERGYSVRASDSSSIAVGLARERLRGTDQERGTVRVVRESALKFLRGLRSQSADVVYSNLVWNLRFNRPSHVRHFREVRRVLRPGGVHLYSVRSDDDPWFGKGRRVGPETFDLAPKGTVMHFFSPAYVRDLAGEVGFLPITLERRREGGRAFPIRVLYVAAGRPAAPPRGRRRSPSTGSRSLRAGRRRGRGGVLRQAHQT